MKFSFDHLVWFFKKPEEVPSLLRKKGIHVVNGGRHESWGTYNSLVYFGLSYIEFLGIENLSIAEKHQENRLVVQIVEQLSKGNHEGPAKLAIRTDCLDELAIKLKNEGITIHGPLSGERVRADGEVIKWSLLFPESEANELPLPFFIQWEKSDEERLADLEKQGLIGPTSPNFESVCLVVRDLESVCSTWGQLLGLKEGEEFVDSTLNARCRKMDLSGTNLLFCTPLGEGPAEKVLKEKGETPFLVNLTETNQLQFFEGLNGMWRFQ